jgi:hypothetical protein
VSGGLASGTQSSGDRRCAPRISAIEESRSNAEACGTSGH